jgi:hypothetical protein
MLAIALYTAILHVTKLGLMAEVLASEALHGFICAREVLDFN